MTKKNYSTRNSNFSQVGEAINDLLEHYKLTQKYQETQVVQAWSKIMGAPIASRTKKVYIKNRVLYVELSSAALRNELNYSKSRIMALYYNEFGQQVIDNIVLK